MSSVDTKCARCGRREYYGALSVQWVLGQAGEDAQALSAYVCRRCAPVFLDKWDELVEDECEFVADEDE